MRISQNVERLELAAKYLEPMIQKVVFVGGSTLDLYMSDSAQPGVRPTEDVDCVIKIMSAKNYKDAEEEMRHLGFVHDIESGVICRFKKGSVVVDLMPTDKKILGFSNLWYDEGMQNKIKIRLPRKTNIYIFTAPYFLASKLEAFKGRGENDYLGSHDMEDFISVLDGNKDVVQSIKESPETVRSYLQSEFLALLRDHNFEEALMAHISDRVNIAGRARIIKKRMWDVCQGEGT